MQFYNGYVGNFCLYNAYFTIIRRVTSLLANLAKKFERLSLKNQNESGADGVAEQRDWVSDYKLLVQLLKISYN